MSTPWTFAVIADSHFHPPAAEPGGIPHQAAWKSDALFNDRNAAAVDLLRRVGPRFVVHLGDVPHPVPGLAAHDVALDVAQATYARLGMPLYMVPGNHDVGDKLHPWAPAPSVSLEKHVHYQARWGAPWWSREEQGLHLLGIDTPVLNSGLPLEQAQWDWLEADLAAAAGRPILAFMHYPPFLLHPDEAEHYDNLAEPARGRLLALFAAHGVRMAFCGHVHHPFWHRVRGTDWVLLPSTAFVRPGYAELARVGPGDEHGRNDSDRLGLCLVHVQGEALELEWVWTRGATAIPAWAPGLGPGEGRAKSGLGLTLRHAWDAIEDVPCDNLDPFRRKQARNDLALLSAWTAGARRLRLPLGDLRSAATRARLRALSDQGFRAVLFTAEALVPEDLALISANADLVEAVELILPRAWLDRPLPELPVARWLAPFGRAPTDDAAYFSHFAPHGFRLGDPDLGRARAEGVVIRLDPEVDPWEGVQAAVSEAATRAGGATPVVLVLLPRAGESGLYEDDREIARRVAISALAAAAWPEAVVILDGFMDHDRGYFPRHGLIDRRGNPRPAWHVLHHLARLLPAGARIQRQGERFLVADLGTIALDGGEGVDLVTGVEGTCAGPVLQRG